MTKNSYTLTPASTEDLSEVSLLVNSAYRGDSSRQGWTTEAHFLDGQRTDPTTLEKEIADPEKSVILCLRKEGEKTIIGTVALQRFTHENRVSCYLGMLTVSPLMQDQGLGKVILQQAEDFAKAWGAGFMTLGVIQLRHELIAFYERRGFKKTSETKPFPYQDSKAGLPLRSDLYFEMFEKALP